jgi:hypothetical protein
MSIFVVWWLYNTFSSIKKKKKKKKKGKPECNLTSQEYIRHTEKPRNEICNGDIQKPTQIMGKNAWPKGDLEHSHPLNYDTITIQVALKRNKKAHCIINETYYVSLVIKNSFHVSPGSWPGPPCLGGTPGPEGWNGGKTGGAFDWGWERGAKFRAPLSRGWQKAGGMPQ